MIPDQLKKEGIYFVLLEKEGKKPFERAWQEKKISYNSPELIKHLENKGNYGVMGGGKKKLIIIDFDDEKIQEEVIKKLPETFSVKTGRGLLHKYFFSNGEDSYKIFDENINTLVDVQGKGKQVVGAGSTHPNGNKYEVVDDREINFIEYSELKALLIPFDKKPKTQMEKWREKPPREKNDKYDDNFLDLVFDRLSVDDVLNNLGIDTSKNPTECPFHSSKGGKCLGFNDVTWHCFHCEESGNIISLIKKAKNLDSKSAIEELARMGNLEIELEDNRKRYIEKLNQETKNERLVIKQEYIDLISKKDKEWGKASEIITKYILKNLKIYTTKNDEKSEVWIYKNGIYIPNGKSEIKEFLRETIQEFYNSYIYNLVIAKIEPDTYVDTDTFFRTTYENEIILQNGILNILTLELLPFTPDKIFFNKLPVNYDIKKKCEKIEKFLKDVLSNEEDIKVFYEVCGFGLLNDYRFEKALMFVGDGRNGKGKSIELIKRLFGAENCCSIPLNQLVPDGFSISELFSKRFNLAGDISNSDFKDTGMFKSLTGSDLIGGKRKFMREIYFYNSAKLIFACNELPMIYDLSRGFWDRWILLEFPYTFVNQEEYDDTSKKDKLKIKDPNIIEKITDEDELSGLLNQALIGLDRLINNKKFSSTIGTEEVKSTWIRKSNSFVAFCNDYIIEDSDSKITKKELRKKYSEYCKKHKISSKSDFVIKRVLQDLYGIIDERINIMGEFWEWVWMGVKWKE